MEYNYLEHHGIKGQKWGVRRYQNPDGTRTAEGKRRDARDRRREDISNRRNISDEELRRRVQRLQLEKQYKDLADADVNRGKVAAKKFLSETGTEIAKKVITNLATGALTGLAAYAIKSGMTGEKMNSSGAAKNMFANAKTESEQNPPKKDKNK